MNSAYPVSGWLSCALYIKLIIGSNCRTDAIFLACYLFMRDYAPRDQTHTLNCVSSKTEAMSNLPGRNIVSLIKTFVNAGLVRSQALFLIVPDDAGKGGSLKVIQTRKF